MSQSLNQAFIKAYAKDKATAAPSKPTPAPTNLDVGSFIVRFDTATCPISNTPVSNTPIQSAGQLRQNSDSSAGNQPVRPTATIPIPSAEPAPSTHNAPHPAGLTPHSDATFRNGAMPISSAAHVNSAKRASDVEIERRSAEELRSTIASQMSRAGAWEAQSPDAFSVDFPMISPYHQRVAHPPAADAGMKGTHFNRPSGSAQAVASRSEPTRAKQAHPPVAPSYSGPVHSSSSPAAAPQVAAPTDGFPLAAIAPRAQGVLGDQVPPQPPPTTSTWDALQTPALSSAASRPNQPTSPTSVETSTQDWARHLASSGDIFRLDRPSYSFAVEPGSSQPQADSGDLSSEILALSNSHTRIDFEPSNLAENQHAAQAAATSLPPPATASSFNTQPTDTAQPASTTPSASAAAASAAAAHAANEVYEADAQQRAQQVKCKERDLRQAKVRIFNPVWEVDSFQWPEVCVELLHKRASAMELVAKNLIEACQDGLQVLAVTSPQSGEGRTTVACCLAKLAGSRGLNVAIVDGDLENPTLSYQTNLDVEQDWKSAIFNQLPLEEVAVHSIEDQVTLVPLTEPVTDRELSIDDNRIQLMLQELSASFDLVIVDMGHMESSRSLVTSLGERGIISAVVAVVDYRSSTRQQVDHCLRRIRQSGIASIGLVENFAA